MTVSDDELRRLGGDVLFWRRKVKELEIASDKYTLDGKERLRIARRQLRQAQKVVREAKRNVQTRMF